MGGKAAGADYWKYICNTIFDMNFKLCKADPGMWFRPATKLDGNTYYQYILLYIDDILCKMESTEKFSFNKCCERFKIKEGSIAPPS